VADRIADSAEDGILRLLERAREADEDALNRLLDVTYAVVLDFLRRRNPDGALRDLEEDVTIEVLMRVAANVHACRARSAPEYWGWVLTIARHEALRVLRSTYFIQGEILAPATLEGIVGGSDEAGAGSVLRPLLPILVAIASELPPSRQDLLGMRFVEGLEYGEIALRIGTSEAAAKRRVQRLLQTMRGALEQAVDRYGGADAPAVRSALELLKHAG
jgi:RNA polymerase sigma factor (sigma-70 family)